MKHKYLEENGISSYADNDWGGTKNPFYNLFRKIKYYFKKKKTGVDPRSCFQLDDELMFWLYEHICQYLNDAKKLVDLEYNTFYYNEKNYSLEEMLILLKETILKYYNVRNQECLNWASECSLEIKYANEVFDILKIVFPYLWW